MYWNMAPDALPGICNKWTTGLIMAARSVGGEKYSIHSPQNLDNSIERKYDKLVPMPFNWFM